MALSLSSEKPCFRLVFRTTLQCRQQWHCLRATVCKCMRNARIWRACIRHLCMRSASRENATGRWGPKETPATSKTLHATYSKSILHGAADVGLLILSMPMAAERDNSFLECLCSIQFICGSYTKCILEMLTSIQ